MILEATGVWKSYPRWQPGTGTIRDALVKRTPPVARRRGRLWALADVDLEIERSAAVALIGHNGAGKSTLLRLCAGLGRPTRGRVSSRGRVAGILALGSWFAAELSGRENAVIAALVLGASRAEARAAVAPAIEFAELEDFADAPLRTYSDGMRLRLALAVVLTMRPDLLVIDEALAVGDIGFQQRAIERVRELRASGMTLLVASHDLSMVVGECERAVWLDGGRVRGDGPAQEVVGAYRDAGRQATLAATPQREDDEELGVRRFGSQEAVVEEVSLWRADGQPALELDAGGMLEVRLTLAPGTAVVTDPRVVVGIHRADDHLLCHEASTANGGARIDRLDVRHRLTLVIERLHLVPGRYDVTVGLYPPDWAYAFDYRMHAATFTVRGEAGWNGVVHSPYRWRGTTSS